MSLTLAFDVYGTLIDTRGVLLALQEHIADQASAFSSLWRDKQLEYSFRRGLMQNYVDFSQCTAQALEYACLAFGLELSQEQKQSLLAAYRSLPAFEDAVQGLQKAKDAGMRLFAFSNGSQKAVQELLQNAGLEHYFQGIVSVEETRLFKPSPAVYCYFLRQSRAWGSETWLISGNPFDVIGAISAGLRGAWVQRSPQAIFDPWEIQPTLRVTSLEQLPERIQQT
ncbi:MAG: haloacid dehalogenase type II [Desulfohalobiaceae bacterium]